eukprot:TRINITY_DN17250_c0_g1_i7.p1 TRINITY_DN17250_c0_g1~~TRINITY_DN17250_c0_g1_i7.p1  ORF type:complete len:204 (+),score=37.91 TRINITY_DN17250_c0_g1_i7:329-940(+)
MERLVPVAEPDNLGTAAIDCEKLFEKTRRIAEAGYFHNDYKLPNLVKRKQELVLIDFELMTPWAIKLAVTSSCIEESFEPLLRELSASVAADFREYCDLFALTMTLLDGTLYRAVFQRLEALWKSIEAPALRVILDSKSHDKLLEVPFEVCSRAPLEAVSANLLDLRGNLFCHLPPESSSEEARLSACAALPQLIKSNGVYWP